MDAFKGGGECDHHDELGLRCTLNTALGLGPQCFEAHRKLVAAAFPGGMPTMDRSTMGPAGKMGAACYEAPGAVSISIDLDVVRMSSRGDNVRVVAEAARMDHPDCGFNVRFESVQRVCGVTTVQVSKPVTPHDRTVQCPSP